MIKNIGCSSSQCWVRFPAHTQWLPAIYNSSSKRSDGFRLPQELHAMWSRGTQQAKHPYTNKKEISKSLKISRSQRAAYTFTFHSFCLLSSVVLINAQHFHVACMLIWFMGVFGGHCIHLDVDLFKCYLWLGQRSTSLDFLNRSPSDFLKSGPVCFSVAV